MGPKLLTIHVPCMGYLFDLRFFCALPWPRCDCHTLGALEDPGQITSASRCPPAVRSSWESGITWCLLNEVYLIPVYALPPCLGVLAPCVPDLCSCILILDPDPNPAPWSLPASSSYLLFPSPCPVQLPASSALSPVYDHGPVMTTLRITCFQYILILGSCSVCHYLFGSIYTVLIYRRSI